MPEYLAPGVYVEEVSFRSKSIEGVSTTTTGFIGPTRYGPTDLEPDILTSLGDFERIYGDGQPLKFHDVDKPMPNYVWHAVRAFFEEGGKRLYVVRTFREQRDPNDPEKKLADGRASKKFPASAADADAVQIEARFPGKVGLEIRIRMTVNLGQNLLSLDPVTNRRDVGPLQDNDIVWISDVTSPISSPPGSGRLYRAVRPTSPADTWTFTDDGSPASTLQLTDLFADVDPRRSDQVRVVTLTVIVLPSDPFDVSAVWGSLPLDPRHRQPGSGALDSVAEVFALHPSNRAQEYRLPIIVTLGNNVTSGVHVLARLNQESIDVTRPDGILGVLNNTKSTDADRSFDIGLDGGDDGDRPTAQEYEGEAPEDKQYKTGLKALEDIDDISIVAAPGSTFGYENRYQADASTINGLLIAHAEQMRYRIAVLDSGEDQAIAQVRAMRGRMDSKYAAFYYPWVRVLDPITRREINLPPSGFVTGIYARNDINRGVYKAPANEVVNLAIGFEQLLNKSQQDVLNPEGINCFRFFEGRGFRLWGARTISSDPEWKYVNLRRYFAYVEHSVDKGTQWAVFEPNGEALWANVRRTVEDFLFNEWSSGALLGDKPEKAYFVKCDRSTMTQNDLDNGRLICLVGISPLRPAEFVIFRVGQWTADRKA